MAALGNLGCYNPTLVINILKTLRSPAESKTLHLIQHFSNLFGHRALKRLYMYQQIQGSTQYPGGILSKPNGWHPPTGILSLQMGGAGLPLSLKSPCTHGIPLGLSSESAEGSKARFCLWRAVWPQSRHSASLILTCEVGGRFLPVVSHGGGKAQKQATFLEHPKTDSPGFHRDARTAGFLTIGRWRVNLVLPQSGDSSSPNRADISVLQRPMLEL